MKDETTQKQENTTESKEVQKQNSTVWQTVKSVLKYIFIDGLGGMATGLFCTLIIGTIICQIATLIGTDNFFGKQLYNVGSFAKILMGIGIALGMSYKLGKKPLVAISAGVAGMIGAYAKQLLNTDSPVFNGAITTLSSVGEPLGAFVAAFVAMEVGSLVVGKTKVDIIVTPLATIISGAVAGLLVGPPITAFMSLIGDIVDVSAQQQPILMGILVAVIMGVALTLPISSAAIGIALNLHGIAGGAAMIGCCCQMVGFAVMSFKENKWGGLAAQGLGTSMLQMPNLVKHPVCWLPPVITSAILGPVGVMFGVISSPVGSGMGTAGLVGPIATYSEMTAAGTSPLITLLLIALFSFILPAAICLGISLLFRKFNLIKDGDLKLDL